MYSKLVLFYSSRFYFIKKLWREIFYVRYSLPISKQWMQIISRFSSICLALQFNSREYQATNLADDANSIFGCIPKTATLLCI